MIKIVSRDSQLMKDVLRKISESLRNLDKIFKNVRFALRSILTLSQIYDGMNPQLQIDKLPSADAKMAIVDSTEDLGDGGDVSVSIFFRGAQAAFRSNNISFPDKYFHYLFAQWASKYI